MKNDDDFVDVPGMPNIEALLPAEIWSRLKTDLFSTIRLKHLDLLMDGPDLDEAKGTTRKGPFKLFYNEKILMLLWQQEPNGLVNKPLYKELVQLLLWEKLTGHVRNQFKHILCWAYSSTDLVSALRQICKLEADFVPLSTWYLSSHVKPELLGRDGTAKEGHSCYATTTIEAFQFMLDSGVPKERVMEFDCNEDPPADEEPNIFIDSYATLDDLEEALKQLRNQPIGASLLEFSELWTLQRDDIYYGPTKANSSFLGYHGVDIVDIQIYKGEVVALCKSSNGVNVGRDGYFRVSLATLHMIIGFADEESSETVRPTPTPQPLLCNFIFPVINETRKTGEKRHHVDGEQASSRGAKRKNTISG